MRLFPAGIAAALFALGAGSIHADTLQMPDADTGTETQAETFQMEMPVRGMSKRQVEERFGAPLEKVAPVGDPPISRWVYRDYTVYFEHQYVIHAVLND